MLPPTRPSTPPVATGIAGRSALGPLVAAIVVGGISVPSPATADPPADAVVIPAGTFQQGSAREPDAPERTVQLPAYRIGRTEVSVDEYAAFVAAGGYTSPRWWTDDGRTWLAANPGGAGAEHRAAGRSGDHPVVAVTRFEAEAYCAWSGGRLPTEAEWERAACGTDDRRFPWGDDESADARWYAGGKFGALTRVETAPASEQDAALASPSGTLHMAGNVWEWTADRYHARAWGGTGTTAPLSTANTPWNTLRGGSFMNLPSYCSCQHREPARPERVAYTVGFRCVWEAP